MILKNARIVLEDKIIENGYLKIEGNKIVEIKTGNTDLEGIDIKND